jgi:hypothetical protein
MWETKRGKTKCRETRHRLLQTRGFLPPPLDQNNDLSAVFVSHVAPGADLLGGTKTAGTQTGTGI